MTEYRLDETDAGRVQAALSSGPQRFDWVVQTLQQPETKIETWLRTLVREGDVCYLYHVPEALDEWRSKGPFEELFANIDCDAQQSIETKNNLSPAKEHRYYLNEDDLPVIETEFPELITGDRSHRLEISFGPDHENRDKHSAYGTVESVANLMFDSLADAERLYANISYSSTQPTYSFQMQYQGTPTEPVINAIVRNADAIATALEKK